MVGIIGGSNVLSVFAIHDILVHIMQFLPDFSSLSAMVPVSRQIHAIFKHHPIYVARSVAYNQIGPALPQALRVVRHCQNDDHGRDPSKWPSEEEVLNTLITPQEAHILARNARIVLELEGLYYEMTEKPYPMLRSTLSDISRVRFHRAMYRFWLYALAFHPDESAVPGTGIDNWLEYKELFFNQISNDSELHELFEIYWMLSEQAWYVDWLRRDLYDELDFDPDLGVQYAVSNGPEAVLQLYRRHVNGISGPEDRLGWEMNEQFQFIREPLRAALQKRSFVPPDPSSNFGKTSSTSAIMD